MKTKAEIINFFINMLLKVNMESDFKTESRNKKSTTYKIFSPEESESRHAWKKRKR